MDQQEALEWATRQDVVKVRTLRMGEEDKFTFVVGEYLVSPLIIETHEEAEKKLQENIKLTKQKT